MPGWMASLDDAPAGRAFGLGLLLSIANPKNLALTAAAATLSQFGLEGGDATIAVLAFVAVGSISVIVPVVGYLVATDRVEGALGTTKAFMIEHNAAIMMVLFLVLGTKMLGQGLGSAL